MAAAQNVTANLNLSLSATETKSTGAIGSTAGGGSLSLQSLIQITDQLTNAASGAKTCDQLYANQLNLNATPTTLHFATGTATDPFGNTITMARIRLIAVQVVTTTSAFDVKVSASASNGIAWLPAAASGLEARANGGALLIYDPNSSGGGSGNTISGTTDGLTLDPGANQVYVNVIVIGNSVA